MGVLSNIKNKTNKKYIMELFNNKGVSSGMYFGKNILILIV